MATRFPSQSRQAGFTLVELIMVIVILGVIGGTVAVFMKGPIDAYFDTARRAGIADVADTTVRRMARDLRKALPNSIRLSGSQCVEFIPTRLGGRYRAQDIVPVPTDYTSLRFDAADDRFNMLGINTALPADQRVQLNDLVAVYNLGISGASAYAGDNTATVSGVAVSPANANETQISLSPSLQFPLESPTRRFHVIPFDEKVVSYRCSGTSLYRQSNYAYNATTACNTPLATTTPVIATQAICSFAYDNSDMRNGLVKLSLTFSNAGESVSIYHEVHVNNTP
jgi:MSHA biogenesis protein MshO